MKKCVFLFLFLVVMVPPALGAIRNVPGSYPTIQAGIDAAVNGDSVLVANGTYRGVGNRDISFDGKSITVTSAAGPTTCIIDCEYAGRGFLFYSNENENAVLDGFTVQNGYTGGIGGGILIETATPTIRNCMVMTCQAGLWGGGMAASGYWSRPQLENILIAGNQAMSGGGIAAIDGAAPHLWSCRIIVNNATDSEEGGGGIYAAFDATPTLWNVLIAGNQAAYGAGMFCYSDPARGGPRSLPVLKYCTIASNIASAAGGGLHVLGWSNVIVGKTIMAGNEAMVGPEGYVGDGGALAIDTSLVQGGQGAFFVETGSYFTWSPANLSGPPLFVTSLQGPYCLAQVAAGQPADSPAVNCGPDQAVNTCDVYAPELVCMGELTTRTDGVPDYELADWGFHYPPLQPTPTPTLTPTSTPTQTPTATATPLPPPIPTTSASGIALALLALAGTLVARRR